MRRIALGLAAASLLALVYAAGMRGLADTAYYPARRAMADWAQNKRQAAAPQWEAARDALRRASDLAPANALYVEELGRLYEMRAMQLSRDEARAWLELSRGQFRQAASMRPGSPYAWSSLALVKFRMGELDYEFYGALERAARFGPWEPAVQLALSDIGLAGWPWLALPGKVAVLGAVERGMLRQEAAIRRLAQQHPASAAFCRDALVRARNLTRVCAG